MDKLKTQFVPYELALKLKDLGFKEGCFARYRRQKFQSNTLCRLIDYNSHPVVIGDTSAPLYQQAFEWFRENHNLIGEITHCNNPEEGKWVFDIAKYPIGGYVVLFDPKKDKVYDTYKQSQEACLLKLIELKV